MRCEKVQEKLAAYLDSSLGWLARRQMDAHLKQCAACRRELQTLRNTVNLVRSTAEARQMRIPRDMTASVMARITATPAPTLRRRRPLVLVPVAVAAAAALAIPVMLHQFNDAPEAKRPNAAYVQEYAQFRAGQEISGGSGMFVLADELMDDSKVSR